MLSFGDLLSAACPAAAHAAALTQARARVEAEIDAAADRVPFGRERDGLADGVQVAPALGEAAFALE